MFACYSVSQRLVIAVLCSITWFHHTKATCVDLVKDCGAKGDGSTDDTHSFHVCQQLASSEGHNGCIYVPPGDFRAVNIAMNVSNIEWNFDNEAVIAPGNMTHSAPLITVGGQNDNDTTLVTNVSLLGTWPGKFTLDISHPQFDPWNVRAVMFIGGLSHFTIANCRILLADSVSFDLSIF